MTTEDFIEFILSADALSGAELVNWFADEFREGADLRLLVPLLTHQDPKLAGIGAWIASEVVDDRRGREVLVELAGLLTHDHAAVRFEAMRGVARLVRADEQEIVACLVGLLIDDAASVRRQALAVLGSMDPSSFRGLSGPWKARIQPLLPEAPRALILQSLRSGDQLSQWLAVIGVARHRANDRELMDEVMRIDDDDVQSVLSHYFSP